MSHSVAPPDSSVWVPVVGEQGYQFIYDMWLRSGGVDDAVASVEIGELYEQGIQTSNEGEILSEIEDLPANYIDETTEEYNFPLASNEWRSLEISGNYTANAFEFLAVTKKAIIKLPEYPDSDDIASLVNVNGKTITIDGNGHLIHGETTVKSRKKNTVLNFHYFAELGEWYMR